MAQLAYGSITITDTNDIESIIIEYARNQSTSNPPDATTGGWSTTRPAWAQGYYIWQRARIHKSGTDASADTFGTAVCITGSTGQTGGQGPQGETGAAGRSLTATETKYTSVASGTTKAQVQALAESNWSSNVPSYNSAKPDYWVRIVNTYDKAPLNETIYYKDQGLTDAVSKANDAWNKADQAQTDASNALSQASAANQATALLGGHFIYNAEWQTTNTPHSANVVQTILKNGVDVTTDPTKWDYNVHIGANGIRLRNNESILSSWTGSALTFYQPGTSNKGIELTSSALNFYDSTGQIAQATFGGTQAVISGTINVYDGKIGNSEDSYWYIGNYLDYNQNNSAAIKSHGTAFIQLGDSSTWRVATNRIHSAWNDDSSTGNAFRLHFPVYDDKESVSKYWDVGMHLPLSRADKFLYIRNANSTQTLENLGNDLEDSGYNYWTYQFWVDGEGNVHAPGFYIGNSTTPIGGGAGTVAERLTQGYGSATQPVYFNNNGVPTNTTYTLNAAGAKGVDTSISASSTSTNLPTSQAVAAFVEGKGYITSYVDEKVKVTNANTTKLWVTGTATSGTNTGTLSYDTNVYITTTSGTLHATTFDGTSFTGTAAKATADADGNAIKTTYLKLSGGQVTGPVSFGSSVTIDEATVGDLVVNGNASFTNNINANTINGVSVGSNPKFTDNNTTYTFANGTNGFTVTPSGGTAQTVTVTPSISNNVTGSGTSGYLVKWNGTNTVTNGPALGSDTTKFLNNKGEWAVPAGTYTYTLPLAANGTRGGVQIGYTTSGKNYAVQLSSEKMYVNVPWENTTYSAGTGLSLSGTTFSNTGVTGVKGSAESTYRTGQVNLTTADIGAVARNDELLTTNPFAPPSVRGPYISKIDNAFYVAHKRFSVTYTGDSTSNVSNMFDGSYESQFTINAGGTATITIDCSATTTFPGYPYGNILISFYHNNTPQSVSGRVYCNYEPHGIGWHDITFSPLADNGTYQCVYRGYNGKYAISKFEITINAQSSIKTYVTQIEMHLDRPDASRTPFVSKYQAETLYYNLTAPKFIGDLEGNVTGNVSGTAANVTGTITIAHGGTSATTAAGAINNLLSGLPVWSAVATDTTYFIRQDTGGSASYGKVPASTLWTYISEKLPSWSKASTKPSYSYSEIGSAPDAFVSAEITSTGAVKLIRNSGNNPLTLSTEIKAVEAVGATKLTDGTSTDGIDRGSADQPVYFDDGVPVAGYYIPKLNGSNQTAAASFYAPTSGGTAKQILVSNGNAAPAWQTVATGGTNGTIKIGSDEYAVKGLAAAAYKALADSSSAGAIGTGTNVTTERDVYYGLPTINNAHNYTSSTTIYAPTSGGTSTQVLIGAGTTSAPVWTSISSLVPTSATNATNDSDGNPINTTYIKKSIGTAAGDIIYWSAASTPTRLAKGSNGQVLKLANGVPTWGTDNNDNTNYYHTTGSWNGLTYSATANGGAGALAFTLPTASVSASGVINTSEQVLYGKKTFKNTTRIYSRIGASSERSQWYKITFPYYNAETTSAAKWFMNSFDLHFGGGYNNNPSGVAHVSFYWTRLANNGAWSVPQVAAKIDGILTYKISLYYRIAEPGVLYVNNNSNNYNGLWLDNLFVDDSSSTLDWSTTTIVSCSAITTGDYTEVPTVRTYISTGTDYVIANNTIPSVNDTYSLGSISWKWKDIYATTFNGALAGNADTATKATQDSDGKVINTTYLKLSGGTMSGSIIMPADKQYTQNLSYKYEGAGGWARHSFIWYDKANVDFAHIGVYGSGNTLSYMYIGSNSWDGNNLRISPTGLVSAPGGFSGNLSGNATNVTGTVAVDHGGTGAITAAGARANLGTWSLVSDSYNTLMPADGTSNGWIKIGTSNTSYGLLPSASGGAGSGHNYIGTSSWYWKYAYIDQIYGYLNGNISGNATSATKTGVASMWLYSENNNEINFGGSNGSDAIYIGYRAKDSKPIPTKLVFGGSTGTAQLQATSFNMINKATMTYNSTLEAIVFSFA